MYTYLRKRNDLDLLGNEFMSDFFGFDTVSKNIMRTDVCEDEKEYALAIDIPGYDKKDIKIDFNKGYLTVSCKKEKKEFDKKNVVFEERYCGEIERTYYLGDDINEEEIKANFNNGVLNVIVPKLDYKKETRKFINIE